MTKEEKAIYDKDHYAKNVDRILARKKAQYSENKAEVRRYMKEYNVKNRQAIKNKKQVRAYGITLDQKDQILKAQGDCCGICGKTDPGPRGWSTDHDHASLEVRGVLCWLCNTILGALGDTRESVISWNENVKRYFNAKIACQILKDYAIATISPDTVKKTTGGENTQIIERD